MKTERQVYETQELISESYAKCLDCTRQGYTTLYIRNIQGEDQEVQIYPCDYMRYAAETEADLFEVIKRNCHLVAFRSCTEINQQLQTQIHEPVHLPGRIVNKQINQL